MPNIGVQAEDSMSMTMWLYMSVFSSIVSFAIYGISQRRFEFVLIGVMIGVAMYFLRRQLR